MGLLDRSQQICQFTVKNNVRLMSSFSYFHWRTIEQIEKKEVSVTQINIEILQEIVDVILPNGDTVLHRLIHSNVGEFEKLLQLASKHNIKLNILPDRNQQTPLHLCVDKSLSRAASILLDTISLYPLNDHGFFINGALKDAMMLCPI